MRTRGIVGRFATDGRRWAAHGGWDAPSGGMVPVATVVALMLATAAPGVVTAQEPANDELSALETAYQAKAEGDHAAARRAFERALEAGADPQRVHLELGYLAAGERRLGDARGHFEQAARGPDGAAAADARSQLRFLPSHFWMDGYLEGWAWYRLAGADSANLVPTLRLRGLWRPLLDLDFNFYLYGQITRDVASRGAGPRSLPLVYADNHALIGGGAMYRFLDGHMAVFGQLGPAFNLREDGGDLVKLDARVGVMAGIESDECRLPRFSGARALIGGCLEGYGEIVYVSRFDHDLVGVLRGRAGLNLLQVEVLLLQPLFELRALGGKNGDYYNNLVELGVGFRIRLLEPFVMDFYTTAHGGLYYGVENVDPLPDPPAFLELRALLTTYVEVVP